MAKNDNFLSRILKISLLIKGIDGILEFIGGILLFFISSHFISSLINKIFQHELAQDPQDILANYLINLAGSLSVGMKTFAILYLLIHGAIKIGIVLAVWKNKFWAYPLAGIVLGVLILYEIFRISYTHSLILVVLTLIDIAIFVLMWREYQTTKKAD